MNAPESTAAKNFAVALVRKAVEQARLSTICSARAEFADFAPRLAFVRMQNALQNASLFSCQRSLRPEFPDRPTPGGTFTPFTTRQNNKKPGVERRAKPSEFPPGRVRAMLD
jgi:hypothetical protein